MKFFISLLFLLALGGCASPTLMMPDAQILSLSDDELCHYKNTYRSEPRLDGEIAARGLNCDPYFRECLRRGNRPESESMAFCIDLMRENDRLRRDEAVDGMFLFGNHDYDRLRSVSGH